MDEGTAGTIEVRSISLNETPGDNLKMEIYVTPQNIIIFIIVIYFFGVFNFNKYITI